MAKSKVARETRGTKKRAEKPVSDEIRRAAEKIGATPSESAKAEPPARETMAEWTARREALANTPVPLTLAEACDLVGRDLEPSKFQTQVFDVLARDLNVLSDIGESQFESGFEGWCAFQNLRARIELAGKIAAVIGGAS
jgi:hypothetical protein